MLCGVTRDILSSIGNTPLLQLTRIVPETFARIFVKLEGSNPTGSYKDRMALAMIEGAERRGQLRRGMRVVEFTGGSTGSSLAMVCAARGYRFTPICSDAFAEEKLATMRAFGADLILVPSVGGKITPDLFIRMRARAEEERQAPDTFFTDQFNNDDVVEGFVPFSNEILLQLAALGAPTPDVFCGAVGTAGMLMGVARAFQRAQVAAKLIALEPAESPALTKGTGGAHHIEGVGTGTAQPHYRPELVTEARAIPEAEARSVARRLAQEEGILAGTSSGLNVAAALQLAAELGPEATVVTVLCDTGLKYLTGDLYR